MRACVGLVLAVLVLVLAGCSPAPEDPPGASAPSAGAGARPAASTPATTSPATPAPPSGQHVGATATRPTPTGADVTTADDQSTPGGAQAPTRRYINARYQFSIEIPTDLRELGESDNGDGNTFTGGDATVIAYGSNESAASQAETVEAIREQGGQVVAQTGTDADFTITARMGGDIHRTRTLTGSGSSVVVQWLYPQEQQARYDAPAAQSLSSLRAQGLDQSH